MGCAKAHFFGPAAWGPGEGPKGQISLNIIKFQLQSQFQRFFNQTLCVFSHMKDIKTYQAGFSFCRLGHAPGVGLRGTVGVWGSFFFEIQPDLVCTCTGAIFGSPHPGALGRGLKFNFLNMVMWHIKLNGMSSRPRYTEQF